MSSTSVFPPDLSRVPPVLVFRLSNERTWASAPWASDGPASLAAGIRQAWAARIALRFPDAGHPALALRRRLLEIDRWLEERLARPAVSPDQRRTWEAQATHWRFSAEDDYGARPSLHLQVQSHRRTETDWLAPGRDGAGPTGPGVSALITTAQVIHSKLWERSRRAWAHALSIDEFVGAVDAFIAVPVLQVVPPEPE